MTNNQRIEITKKEIEELVVKNKHETDIETKIYLYNEEVQLRRYYNQLLKNKRPLLLTFALVFCVFYGISLAICLPPYIIRGKKMDINEEKINKINTEIECLEKELKNSSASLKTINEDNTQISKVNNGKEANQSSIDKILELKKLYDSDMITKEEFEKLKNNIIG